ncbi:MAG TPA: ABC transporter permease [Gemmatimonadaceae bacterium]|nr:ABC transporter permease [Gemmatimonadaceae bacterium]
MPLRDRLSLSVGFDALRSNPLRTILSTLGVIMGVGAMVAVLAIGDGVELMARQQIRTTTGVLAISLAPQTTQRLDGIRVRRADVVAFGMAELGAVQAATPHARSAALVRVGAVVMRRDSTAARHGVIVTAGSPSIFAVRALTLGQGAPFTSSDVADKRATAVLSDSAARALTGGADAAQLVGTTILLGGRPFTVAAVLGERSGERAEVFIPFGTGEGVMDSEGASAAPARMIVVAGAVEDVAPMRREIEAWLGHRYGARWATRVELQSQAVRVRQISKGLLIYKLLMGSITGVALLVGGVGIMNVLLASVTERTHEIGIRKAVGARGRDILAQFLAESVAVTGSGAALGVLLGFAIAFIAALIMRVETHAPVHAAVTLGTILFAVGTSVVVGVVFGLYPALRASRLSPIDAIRHE